MMAQSARQPVCPSSWPEGSPSISSPCHDGLGNPEAMPAKTTRATAAVDIKNKATGRQIARQSAIPAHFPGYGSCTRRQQQPAPRTRRPSHLEPKAERGTRSPRAPLGGWMGKSKPSVPWAKGTSFLLAAGAQGRTAILWQPLGSAILRQTPGSAILRQPPGPPPHLPRQGAVLLPTPCLALTLPPPFHFSPPFTGSFPSCPVGVDGEERSGISHGGEQKELF